MKAVTGNCGFMILFQDQLAKELPVPVFMSSLLQIPFISRMLAPGDKIGIITSERKSLKEQHLLLAGVENTNQTKVAGMEDQRHFHDAIHLQKGELDFEKVEEEVVQVATRLVKEDEKIKAILLECTDLPPYAAAVQETVNLPVFDFITMMNYVFSALVRKRFEGFV